MENNKNKKSVKFQGDMLFFFYFIQVFVFTRNHHLNDDASLDEDIFYEWKHILASDIFVVWLYWV